VNIFLNSDIRLCKEKIDLLAVIMRYNININNINMRWLLKALNTTLLIRLLMNTYYIGMWVI